MTRVVWIIFLLAAGVIAARGQGIELDEFPVDKPTYAEMWDLREAHRGSAEKLDRGVILSEKQTTRMADILRRSRTVVERSANFGRMGPEEKRARTEGQFDPAPGAHNRGLRYTTKAADEAILEAAFDHLFGYRADGLATTSEVYFLGVGDQGDDPPDSVLARMSASETAKAQGVIVRPVSKALFVTQGGIRDADTGAYGVMFRVNAITPLKDGDVRAVASFAERDATVFTKTLLLRQVSGGWKVISDEDYAGL